MIWLILSLAVVAGSPIGRAIAERLTGRTPDPATLASGDLERIGWMEDRVLHRIADLEERLDTIEHLLGPPPSSGPGGTRLGPGVS